MAVVTEEGQVNQEGTLSRNGQASHCRRCCASQTTGVDPTQRRRLSDYSQRRPSVTAVY